MTGRSRAALAAVLPALVAVALVFPAVTTAQPLAADWTLESIDGAPVRFHDVLADGPVVISFWATWCKPCLKEMPHLDRLAGEYADDITVLAVSTDASKSVAKVAPYIRSKGYANMTVLLDPGAEVQNILQIGAVVPQLVMFDRQGRIIYRHEGYKEGDEVELAAKIAAAVAADAAPAVAASASGTTSGPDWSQAVSATNRFEYSYDTDTRREIFENWMDVEYRFGAFRTGLMLNSRAPSEEGDRENEIRHRWFEYGSGNLTVRAGHFYGLFGRGLVFNAYEDRTVRVDTRLDGVTARWSGDRVRATVFSGSPSSRDLDLRAMDVEGRFAGDLYVGLTGLTYQPDDFEDAEGRVHRENVGAVRLRRAFAYGDVYLESGWKTGYDFDPVDDGADYGHAHYANVNLYRGPFSVSFEGSDYERFEVVSRADGVTALNRPPALAREFTWTLLNRAPHTLNANDEVGRNLDLMYADKKWSVLVSGADIERQDGATVYQLGYASITRERMGDFRLVGAFGFQDSEGLRQTAAGEVTWFAAPGRALSLQVEQQHVRPEGSPGVDLGAYDERWIKLEYETAPRWSFAAVIEFNNKYPEQRLPGEDDGPFPAGQVTFTHDLGGSLNLWFGKRQAGFLCSGGVCKFEPEFEGVELFGSFRL